MSHILEEYAKNLGVLISKPIISQHYFPIVEDKYIVINLDDSIQSKNYKYYNLVLELLEPILLEKQIKIIQIDVKNDIIKGVNKAIGSLSFKQYCYIISKSIMYIGTDSVYSHYAGTQNIPIINLFGNIYSSISDAYWLSNDKKKNISAPWSVKPCLSTQDPKSEINLIRAEQIAQSVLDLLQINYKINFKTIQIGEMFLNEIYEVVPTSFHELPIPNESLIFIRVDYGIDEISLLQYCNKYKCSIISDKLLQLSPLEKIRNNVKKLAVFIDKNSETIPDRYFEILKIWGIEFQILVKNENDLGFLKNKYFEQNVNLYSLSKEKPQNVQNNASFFSNKIIFKDGKQYASKAHLTNEKNVVDSPMNVIDTLEYWQEQAHHYYYEQN